jgi:endo-1,4-beta-xylanase
MPRQRLITRRRALWLGLGTVASLGAVGAKGVYRVYRDQRIEAQALAMLDPKRSFAVQGTASLKQRAAAKGILYGSCMQREILVADPKVITPFSQECAMLVPGWELKWTAGSALMRPAIDTFDFKDADWIVNFAQKQGFMLRGHTLVWHLSLPGWFEQSVNRQNAAAVMANHIKTVAGRYAGKLHSWDVLNEVIEIQDGRPDGLRKQPWLELLGPDYIDLAFRLTAKADPKAMLVYNENGIESDTPQDDAKREAVLALLTRLKAKGTPIGALGIQSHLSAHQKINPQKLRKFLADVAKLGLKILVTELDVADYKLPADQNQRDQLVAGAYEDFLTVVLQEPAVIAVVTWGLIDSHSWLQEVEHRRDQLPVRPLPLDRDFKRKLAWKAMARAFDQAPRRSS